MFIPYTYLIGWSKFNYYYYGVEYSQRQKIANPSNLWTTYFTSSKHVALARTIFGEPDIVEVRKTFTTAVAARGWEHKVLRRLKVVSNFKWLNATDNKSIANTPESERRRSISLSKALKGKTKSPEHIAKLKNIKRSDITKSRIRAARLGTIQKQSTCDKRSVAISRLFWVNNGVINLRVETIPVGFVLGRLNFTPPALDSTIYNFIHKSGRTFIGTRKELITNNPSYKIISTELGMMIHGKYKSHRGWSLTS